MKTHKDLNVWKKSIEFVSDIYKITNRFPEDEKFGLVSQIRRASISIPSNIAEGAARGSDGDYIRFLYFSLGSSAEIETQLIIARNLGMLSLDNFDRLESMLQEIMRMLLGLISYLRSKD